MWFGRGGVKIVTNFGANEQDMMALGRRLLADGEKEEIIVAEKLKRVAPDSALEQFKRDGLELYK